MSDEQGNNGAKAKRGRKGISKERSPNYPVMDLGKALEKATPLYAKFGAHEIPIGMAHECCGYKALSGAGNQCIAALKAYGFVNVIGKSDQRKVTMSAEGTRIIRKAPDKEALLKEAALKPAIYRELWDRYQDKGGIPIDGLLRQYLVWERPEPRFNEKSVGGFIADFRATLALANLLAGDIIGEKEGDNGIAPPNTGDYVQWASQGVCQFAEPRKVLGVSDDGQFAFVEGSETGLPMSELTTTTPDPCVAVPVAISPANPFFKPKPPQDTLLLAGMAKEQKTLDEGPAVLTWPDNMSKESVEELEYWLNGVIRRAKRKAGLLPPSRKRERIDESDSQAKQ